MYCVCNASLCSPVTCFRASSVQDGLESDSVFMTEAGWKWTPRTMGNPWMSYRPVTDKYQGKSAIHTNAYSAVNHAYA